MPIAHAPINGRTEDEYSSEQISAYFLEIDGLLDRIERAATHYQTLGVERSASHEQIKLSYQETLGLLFPPYGIAAVLSGGLLLRLEQAFNKSSQAFSALASFSRRKQYDATLGSPAANQTFGATKPRASKETSATPLAKQSIEQEREQQVSIAQTGCEREVYKESSKTSGRNRRRCERFKLSIPVRVIGSDRKNGKWDEMAETIDVSRTGVNLKLRKNVRHGTVLFITLPLPVKLRSHGYSEPSYNVYALVRRVEPQRKGMRVVGLEFLGEHPPVGFLEKPWLVFRTKRWSGAERRREPREQRAEAVTVEYFSETMEPICKEDARTENISRSGLRIAVREAPAEFDVIRVTSVRRGFESFAKVRNRYLGKDGLERLCLQFNGNHWPL
ncbi:MAG TPA: PilZ domain-containing protein [Blastocatellia bacterium]|nr:PilZ domain-containing protein [Blastocatellia bacterium]